MRFQGLRLWAAIPIGHNLKFHSLEGGDRIYR